jgi:hypothetical protein
LKRSILLALAAIALAVGLTTTAAAGAAASASDGAQAAQKGKAKKKAAKKKAAKCKAAKKKGKAKGKGKARRSAVADSAAKRGKGKAKGKKKVKRNCGKAKGKSKPKVAPRRRARSPYEQKIVDRYRERREQMEERRRQAQEPLTNQDVAPADGTYTAASAPGLTVAITGDSTHARVVYTVSPDAFDATCKPHTAGEAVDITGPITISQSTKRGSLMLHASQPVGDPSVGAARSQSVTGSIGQDGSFDLSISASFPYPSDMNATCSAFPPPKLAGTLVK